MRLQSLAPVCVIISRPFISEESLIMSSFNTLVTIHVTKVKAVLDSDSVVKHVTDSSFRRSQDCYNRPFTVILNT